MKKRCVWGMGIGLCCFILVFPGASLAAEKKFPTKPIQIIVPFQPGETDNVLRPFIEKMPEYLGQPVSFVYKPGAAGAVGAAFVASSKPDGHTLVAASVSPILLLPLTNKDVGYTREAFAPVCSLAEGFLSLAIQSSARWKNLPELVAEAKKDPAKITYASTGTFGISHIAGEAFSKDAGIKLNHIPAQGAGRFPSRRPGKDRGDRGGRRIRGDRRRPAGGAGGEEKLAPSAGGEWSRRRFLPSRPPWW